MSKAISKAWGTSQAIFKGSAAELHRIEVLAGGFCSIHKHQYKSNLFFVETGELLVRTFSAGQFIVSCQTVGPGESFDIPAGVLHQFEATKPTVAYEHYSTNRTIDPLDIVRYTTGGVNRSQPCKT